MIAKAPTYPAAADAETQEARVQSVPPARSAVTYVPVRSFRYGFHPTPLGWVLIAALWLDVAIIAALRWIYLGSPF